jgi:hypothetical protein
MNAQTYLMVTTRLAYYEAMQKTAPARIDEKKKTSRGPRRRQGLLRREHPVILLRTGNQNA